MSRYDGPHGADGPISVIEAGAFSGKTVSLILGRKYGAEYAYGQQTNLSMSGAGVTPQDPDGADDCWNLRRTSL